MEDDRFTNVERSLSRGPLCTTPTHRFSSHTNDSLPALAAVAADCHDCGTAPVAGKLHVRGSAMEDEIPVVCPTGLDWRVGMDSMAAGSLSAEEG